jgi:phage terminase small subunit
MSDATLQHTLPLTPQQRFDAALAELRPRHRAFVVEYLRDLHQRNAAIRAGFSAKSADQQASELRRNPKISAAIEAGMDLQVMPASEILTRLSTQARGDMSDYLRVDEEEVTLQTVVAVLTPEEEVGVVANATGLLRGLLPDDEKERRAVKISTATISRSVARLDLLAAGKAGKLANVKKYTWDPESGKVSIELYSAKDALELLGKHRKLWGDDPAGGIMKYLDVSKLTPDQLERLSAGEDPYAVLLGR